MKYSRRTILRDIDALCQAGIPVVTVQGGNGGISIMDGYKINKSVLTVEELQDLTAALRGLDSVSETSGLERLMMKLAPENDAVLSLSDSIVIDLASHYKDSLSEKIALLKQAIHEKRVISFDYYSAGGESRRTVEPVVIEFRWQSWYVFRMVPRPGGLSQVQAEPPVESYRNRPDLPAPAGPGGESICGRYISYQASYGSPV